MKPTLSVILPACNEEKRLPRQLAAILGQSRPCDQLVLRDDGSTDGTYGMMLEAKMQHGHRIPIDIYQIPTPSGINRAFNESARCTNGDWLYLASANDEVLPSAFAQWAAGVEAFPDARIACGSPYRNYLGWLPKMGFLTAQQFRLCVQRQYCHGCGTFIRRDAWEQYGCYREDLGSLADFFLYNAISLREGLLYLPEAISKSSFWHSASGHQDTKDKAKRAEIVGRIRELLAGEFADLKDAFETTSLAKVMRIE